MRQPVVRRSSLLAVGLICLLGASGASRAVDEPAPAGDPLQLTPAPGRALVYFLNPGSKEIDVFLDRSPAGILSEHSFFAVQAEPGRRIVWGSVKGQAFNLEADRMYVLIYWTAWTIQKAPPLAESVNRLKLRYVPPTPKQTATLARRLADGDLPWALQSLGELPLRFDHVSCGGRALLLLPLPVSWGVFTVDERQVTFNRSNEPMEVPVSEIRKVDATPNRRLEGWWDVSISYGSEKEPLQLNCVVAEGDAGALRGALRIAMDRAARSAKAPPEAAPVPAGSPLERAERLAGTLEALEKARVFPGLTKEEREKNRQAWAAKLTELPEAAWDLNAYLGGHPDEVPALLTAVRLGRLQEDHPGLVRGEGLLEYSRREAESRERRARLQSYVDRVLRLEPENAGAYLLQARLHALDRMKIANDVLRIEPGDFDQASASARKAAELRPGNREAIEFFARYLLRTKRSLEEIVASLRKVAGSSHPIPLLLADQTVFPLPEGAVFLSGATEAFGLFLEMAAPAEAPSLWAEFRFRVYVVPGTFKTVQSHYRGLWPRFGFVVLKNRDDDSKAGPLYAQTFAWGGEGLQPAGDATHLTLPEGGMAIFVIDARALPAEFLGLLDLPEGLKPPQTLVWVVSRRSVEEPGPADV